jgi:hypothetical protein
MQEFENDHKVCNIVPTWWVTIDEQISILCFTFCLLNNSVNSSDYEASTTRRLLNDKLERIWKEMAVA